MNPTAPGVLYETHLPHLALLHRGKVRDVYDAGENRLLMVACDRLSAFDVVLPTAIPGKGALLTELSNFWFARTASVIQNHLLPDAVADVTGPQPNLAALERRGVVVKKLKPLPVEAIVRGYVAGSGWTDYQRTGSICGHQLPPGLAQAEQLPEPIFTPSTKASVGAHDENISRDAAADLIGKERAEELEQVSLKLYREARSYAAERGIIIADTKFEFGMRDGEIMLIDEVLTPDSSRFWPVDKYEPGRGQPSFDKQFVRDWLQTTGWDKNSAPPQLPEEIVAKTRAKYVEAYEKLVNTNFEWAIA